MTAATLPLSAAIDPAALACTPKRDQTFTRTWSIGLGAFLLLLVAASYASANGWLG